MLANIIYKKSIIKNCNVFINRKNLHNQPIDSDIKRYEEIRKINNRARRITILDVYLIMNTSKIITD